MVNYQNLTCNLAWIQFQGPGLLEPFLNQIWSLLRGTLAGQRAPIFIAPDDDINLM
jgi:hypothetical protein